MKKPRVIEQHTEHMPELCRFWRLPRNRICGCSAKVTQRGFGKCTYPKHCPVKEGGVLVKMKEKA